MSRADSRGWTPPRLLRALRGESHRSARRATAGGSPCGLYDKSAASNSRVAFGTATSTL